MAFFLAASMFIAFGYWENSQRRSGAALSEQHANPTAVQTVAVPSLEPRPGLQSGVTSNQSIDYAPAFDPRTPYMRPNYSQRTPSQFDPNDDYWGLPRTDGVELVAGLCSSCHSLEIVMQQRMTPDRWAYTLTWMSESQGMAQLDEETRGQIYEYLITHFSNR